MVSSATLAFAATNPHVLSRPQARISQTVDVTKVAARPNSHPSVVDHLTDGGRVNGTQVLKGMTMVLSGTDAQEFELKSLVDSQQDKTSANYHQWMTPDSFGASFGADPSDIAKITDWLKSSGMTVTSVGKSNRIIVFSGKVADVESAFHTEMHQYTVHGKTSISNATDLSLPRAVAGVVNGVVMNNLPRTRDLAYKGTVTRGSDGQLHLTNPNAPSPDVTLGSSHYIGGADLPILFNSKSLLSSGVDGTGIKIGIIGRTDILLNDIQTYRTAFGLKPNNPNFIIVGQDPQTQPGDDSESDLDVEASGAMAPGATIDFYVSPVNDLYYISDVLASAYYSIENNSDDVLSMSYGEAESDLGADGLAIEDFLWEQAAAQGISVFISSGDSGPDTYDDGQAYARTASQQYSVSGDASSQFNVAVGGTMMDESNSAVTYWSPTNILPGNISALGYIPEQPWNEGALGNFISKYGGFGGIVSESSGVSAYISTPSWQTGPGVPTTDPTPVKGTITYQTPGPHRYLPDVSLEAAAYDDGFIVCSEGSCLVGNDGSLLEASVFGGTSIAAPSMAGVQAVIDQKNGGRQGNPNYYYYKLAAMQSATACVSSAIPLADGTTCSFHDIQVGNNYIPSKNGGTVANGNYVGWAAGPGFDNAIGLGSPDIANLATNWSKATFTATTTSFTLTPTTTASAGTSMAYTIKVAPTSGTGTPTGDVSIIAQTTAPNGAIGFVTLSGGAASGSLPNGNTLDALPAGTYKVYAHYAGDTTFGGSNSAALTVTVGQQTSTVNTTSYSISGTTAATTATTSFAYGANIYFDTYVCDPSGTTYSLCSTGEPTGSITYTLTGGATTLTPLVTSLNSADDAYLLSGFGIGVYNLTPNYPIIPPGTYTVGVAYGGDATYKAATGTPFTITVGPATTSLTLTASSMEIAPAATATIAATVATISATYPSAYASGALVPTGTVTFVDTTTNTSLGTCTLSAGTCTFTTKAIITAGAHTITATYSGDTDYATLTKTTTVTVGGTAGPTPTITYTVNNVAATGAQVGNSVNVIAAVASPATGTVSFYDGALLLGTGTISTTTHTATRSVTNFTAGSHTITAVYGGSTTYDSSTSAASTFVVAQNTPVVTLQATGQSATGAPVALLADFAPSPDNQAYNGTTGVYNPMSPAPTGSISFYDNGTSIGTAALTYFGENGVYNAQFTSKTFAPGVHTLTAKYPGDANYAGATSTTSETFSVGLTTLKVTAPAQVGANVAFPVTATVTPVVANTAPAGGTVTFMQGTTVLGMATVTNGVASTKITVAGAAGTTATITAVYSGDLNYYTSTATTTVAIITPAFTISISPNSFVLSQQYSGYAVITGTPTGYYTGTATLACSNLPTNTACRFLPAVLTFDGSNTATTTTFFVIDSTKSSLLWIPAVFFAGILLVFRRHLSVRNRRIVSLAVILCATMAGVGCSGNNPVPLQTPTGSSTVTVTATGTGTAGAPNSSATTTFTLTITQ